MSALYIKVQLETLYYEAQVKMVIAGMGRSETDYYKPAFGKGRPETRIQMVISEHVILRALNALKLDQRPLDFEKKYVSPLKAALIDRRVKKMNETMKMMTDEQKRAFISNQAVQSMMGKINVRLIEETVIFTINVKDVNPDVAARVANAVSRSYVIFDLEQQAAELKLQYGEKHSTVMQLRSHIKDMEKTLDGRILPVIDAIGPASVKIMQQATQGVPMYSSHKTSFVMAFIVSIALGSVLVFLLEYLDHSIRSPQDIEKFLNIPCIGSIPKRKPKEKFLLNGENMNGSNYLESINAISNQIYLLMENGSIKSLLITDTEVSSDTSIIIANIGNYLARKKHKVLIVDVTLRNSVMSELFNVSDNPGLVDVLSGNIAFEEAVSNFNTGLNFLPYGDSSHSPMALIDSARMSKFISEVTSHYDMILVACSDLKNIPDNIILSSITDATVLAIDAGEVNREVAERLIASLPKERVNIIGAMLNNRSYVIPKIIYKFT